MRRRRTGQAPGSIGRVRLGGMLSVRRAGLRRAEHVRRMAGRAPEAAWVKVRRVHGVACRRGGRPPGSKVS